MAREAGINNINLDLIYGIPGENFESWKNTLEKAVSLAPEHNLLLSA
jgi:oxygen-independent coproporphyrinogen-3 oxidase